MTYRNFDTGEIWTEEELGEIYQQSIEAQAMYVTYEDFLEAMLKLGKQGVGGLVEEG